MGISVVKSKGRNSTDELARERLRVLELAKAIGNVSGACREAGVDRARFYAWRRRYAEYGLEGLKDRPPVHRSHPQTTPAEVAGRIADLALEHPAWGCGRISAYLQEQGVSVSSPTVQSILIRHRLGTRAQRLLRLMERAAEEPNGLSLEQVKSLEKLHS